MGSVGLAAALERSEAPASAEPLITARELAALLRQCERDVYQEAKAGVIPCVRWGGKVRFRYSDVLATLQRRQMTAVGDSVAMAFDAMVSAAALPSALPKEVGGA